MKIDDHGNIDLFTFIGFYLLQSKMKYFLERKKTIQTNGS